MKSKTLLALLILCLVSIVNVYAAPAYPYPIQITQPDGSVITIKMHGDEFFRYQTTLDGRTISQKDDGFFYYATYGYDGITISNTRVNSATGNIVTKSYGGIDPEVAKYLRSQSPMLRLTTKSNSQKKSVHPSVGLVLVVQYKDVKFTVGNPQSVFSRMANEEGYSDNNATGSVRDYFKANSMGTYNPQFDVIGPITLPNDRAYYGANDNKGNDIRPREMIIDACKASKNSGVDFSKYDSNNDGEVDLVYVIYAGNNEAQGGPKESIWPHKWVLDQLSITLDGKRIETYACSSELKGAQGSSICGIGTMCHEFSHTLGLADVYDTGGNTIKNETGLSNISIMDAGNYNNQEHTPPYYNALERLTCGWLTPKTLPTEGKATLQPIYKNEAYIAKGTVEGDFFLFETRDGKGYDAYMNKNGTLNTGLMVYHVDNSTAHIVNGRSAKDHWYYNTVNSYAPHPCFVTVPANVVIESTSTPKSFYPGSNNVTVINGLVDWDGNAINKSLNQIAFDGNNVTFNVISALNFVNYKGTVTNNAGLPVQNAIVILTLNNTTKTQSNKPVYRSFYKATEENQIIRTTDNNGVFDFNAVEKGNYSISIACYGHEPYVGQVTISDNKNDNFTLTKIAQTLQKRVTHSFDYTGYMSAKSNGLILIYKYSAEQLQQKGAVGKTINAVYFYTYDSNKNAVIDIKIDGKSVASWKVTTSRGLNVSALPSQFVIQPNTTLEININTDAKSFYTDDGPAVAGYSNLVMYNGNLFDLEYNICMGFWVDKNVNEIDTPSIRVYSAKQRNIGIQFYSEDVNVDKWIVDVTSADGFRSIRELPAASTRYNISNLNPNTKYKIDVTEVFADKKSKTSIEQTTLANYEPYAAIKISSIYSNTIALELVNLTETPKDIVWKVNNEIIDPNEYVSNNNKIVITAEITWKNNKKEFISKTYTFNQL